MGTPPRAEQRNTSQLQSISIQNVWRVPRHQVHPLPGRQARDQGEMGQGQGHRDQDLRLHHRQGLRLCHRVRQPALRSTLVTGTPTRTSPRSSMPSSRTTTASPLTPSTPPTWTPRRLLETSSPEFPSTPPVSVLVATLTASVSPPESPSSRGWTWRS